MRVRFDDFILDTDRRELLHGTELEPVALRPKAFQLLKILIENRPKAMAQEELYDRVWPETFVERASLPKLVHHLREALADQQHEVIRTIHGFGFSFAATAIDQDASAPLTHWQVVIGDRGFDLHQGENVIGRERDMPIRINEHSISRRHARIIVAGDEITLEDLGSKNGTSLQGKRIHHAQLKHGDIILFGKVVATLRIVPPVLPTSTVR